MNISNQTGAASAGLKARLAAGTALPVLLALMGTPALAQSPVPGLPPCEIASIVNGNLSKCDTTDIIAKPDVNGIPSSLTVNAGGETINGKITFESDDQSHGNVPMWLLVTGDLKIVVPDEMSGWGVMGLNRGMGGIRAELGSGVDIRNVGPIAGIGTGFLVGSSGGDVKAVTAAHIEARGDAVWAMAGEGNLTIENTGTASSWEGRGLYAQKISAIPFLVRITNRGTVEAGGDAIVATNAGGDVSVDNFDYVLSMYATGIVATSNGNGNVTVHNTGTGTVDAFNGNGISARAEGGNVTVVNEGNILGGGEGAAGIRARALGSTVRIVNTDSSRIEGYHGIVVDYGNAVIENSGSIMAREGDAIRLGTGNHTLVLKGSAADLAIEGDIVAGGQLAIDTQADFSFAGNIREGHVYQPNFSILASNPSTLGLTKKGEGTLTLSGDNTYAGGTTIEAGVLQVSKDANLGGQGTPVIYGFAAAAASSTPLGGITLAGGTLRYLAGFDSTRSLTVTNAGGTIDTNGNDATLSGIVSGAGSLNKTGIGTLALTGNGSAYGGTLTINQGGIHLAGGSLGGKVDIRKDGSLLVGNGTVDGDLVADTTNNGTLVFNQTGNYDYAGDLDGSGALVKKGSGELLLSGHYAYTGSTVVEGGSVRLEAGLNPETDLVIDGGTFDLSGRNQTVSGLSGGSGQLLLGNGTLVVDQAEGSSFGGSINGTGTFTKGGAGRLNLTGNSTFTGGTFVNGGTLAVNGSLSGSNVTVNDGGTLGGNGTVGGIVGANGGIVAPGNSIGTLKVAGDVAFGHGSVYQVELNAAGQNDRIDATGRAILTGGTVQVLAETGNYGVSTRYTILTAGNGVDGTFAGVTSNLAFLTPTLAYDANNVLLTMSRIGAGDDDDTPVRFSSVAETRNQFNTAEAVEGLGAGNRVFDAVIGQSASGARQAFDALSGEVHAGMAGTLFEDSRLVRDAVLNRLVGPYGNALSKWGFWGQGFGSWGQSDRTANAGSLDRSTTGFLIGLDGEVSNGGRLGIAGGYTSTSLDLDARSSSASIDSYHAAIYGGTRIGNFGIRLGGAYTWHDVDTSRSASFPGYSDSLSAKYSARTGQVFGELGYLFDLGQVKIEPIAGLTYVNVDVDNFREIGGAAALNGFGRSQDVTYSTLGARFSTEFPLSGNTTVTAKGMLGWRHAFDDVAPSSLLAFGSGGNPFTVSSLPIATDALVMEAGLGMEIGSHATVSVSYGGQYARKVQDHSIKASLEVRF